MEILCWLEKIGDLTYLVVKLLPLVLSETIVVVTRIHVVADVKNYQLAGIFSVETIDVIDDLLNGPTVATYCCASLTRFFSSRVAGSVKMGGNKFTVSEDRTNVKNSCSGSKLIVDRTALGDCIVRNTTLSFTQCINSRIVTCRDSDITKS